MPRLIDAEHLKTRATDTTGDCWDNYGQGTADFLEYIEKEPTVDAEPVRHGRWLKNGDRYCECSVCHHEGNISGADNYCWFCGAKMDEVD